MLSFQQSGDKISLLSLSNLLDDVDADGGILQLSNCPLPPADTGVSLPLIEAGFRILPVPIEGDELPVVEDGTVCIAIPIVSTCVLRYATAKEMLPLSNSLSSTAVAAEYVVPLVRDWKRASE